MSYDVRRATHDDLPAIVELFNQAIPLQVNDETAPIEVIDRQEWFDQFDDTHPIWVMTNDRQVIGWCALEKFYPHQAYYRSAEIAIYIHEGFQGRHLGRSMLQFLDQQIEAHLNLKTVIAYIYQENQASQHLFATAGYQKWGELPQISEINGQLRTLVIYGKHFHQSK